MTFGYAPFGIWPVVPCALTAFLLLLQRSTLATSFKLAYCFSFGWFAVGISWVHVSIADFGGLPLIASLALMAMLSGYLALYPSLAFWLLKRRFTPKIWPLAIGLLWLFTEWLRSWMLTGFPWLSIGYSQIDSPLAGWMPVIGETGVSVLVIVLCASLAHSLRSKNWQQTLLLALVVFVSGGILKQYPWAVQHNQPASIAMVQGNIKQELRWAPEEDAPTMEKYRNMSNCGTINWWSGLKPLYHSLRSLPQTVAIWLTWIALPQVTTAP